MHPIEAIFLLLDYDPFDLEWNLLGLISLPSICLLAYPMVFNLIFLPKIELNIALKRELVSRGWIIFVVQPILWGTMVIAIPKFDWIAISGHTLYWHERVMLAVPSASVLFIIVVNALVCAQLRSLLPMGRKLISSLGKVPASYLALGGIACAFAQIKGLTSGNASENSMIFYMWLLVGIAQWSISMLFQESLRNTPVETRTQSQTMVLLIWKIFTAIGLILPFVATPTF